MSGVLRRGWLLIAQAIAISAGVLIAWRAFGPVPSEVPPASVVTVREATPTATPSTSSTRAALVSETAALSPGTRTHQPTTITVELGQRPIARKQ